MDPATTLISAYINYISDNITSSYNRKVNLDVTPVKITYQETAISFQHQIWRIKDKSVCADLVNNSADFSRCTIKAKSLFNEICNSLAKKQAKTVKESKYQRMYCNAAIKYKPFIATISFETKVVNPLEKQCNQLILKAMGSRDNKLKKERVRVCKLVNN